MIKNNKIKMIEETVEFAENLILILENKSISIVWITIILSLRLEFLSK